MATVLVLKPYVQRAHIFNIPSRLDQEDPMAILVLKPYVQRAHIFNIPSRLDQEDPMAKEKSSLVHTSQNTAETPLFLSVKDGDKVGGMHVFIGVI
jgi:hypothetical protein